MARAPDPKIEQAKELFHKGSKLIEIANQLNIPEGTVRSWKNRYKWSATLQTPKSNKSNVAKRHKGGQLGNKNATGPPLNKHAVKHGLFEKYLPEETMDIVSSMSLNPLDILWDQIQIGYAAIVRAQQIMYVKDSSDKTKEKIEYKDGNVIGEKWEVQQAWDKQGNFLKAQARAQSELRSLIKQYDEMLHKDWELATEEQKARISKFKVDVEKASGKENTNELTKLDQMLEEIRKQAGGIGDT